MAEIVNIHKNKVSLIKRLIEKFKPAHKKPRPDSFETTRHKEDLEEASGDLLLEDIKKQVRSRKRELKDLDND